MRIQLSDLDPDLTIVLTGTEPWLDRIYAGYPHDGAPDAKPRAAGTLKVSLEEAGSVHVRGHVKYEPVLNCGRCEKGIPFPLDLPIDMRFMPGEPVGAAKELNLTEADLDTYFIEDGAVDLELLINDSIYLAIPSRLVLTKADETCGICGIDLSADRIYATKGADEPSAKASPFAVLKDLKLP